MSSESRKRVTKAVVPAAGLGTRFLPATKAQAKEMLPVVDKPAIQYVVEEAVRAGLDDVLIITSRGKETIEDHFDRALELEAALERSGKHDLLKEVRATADLAGVHYIRQGEALGLGHAVSVARRHVAGDSFAVLLGDDIFHESSRVLADMLATHERTGGSVVALKEVGPEEISAYGCAAVEPVDGNVVRITEIVEKPSPAAAPSNLAVIGRYVFTSRIFEVLERVEPGKGGEIQLTDAIALLGEEEPVYGFTFQHGRYDIGNKLDYLRANIEFALERDDLGGPLRELLARLVDQQQ